MTGRVERFARWSLSIAAIVAFQGCSSKHSETRAQTQTTERSVASTQSQSSSGGTVTAGGTVAPATRSIEPRADELLRRMSRFLASQQAFSVLADQSTEVVTANGEKLQLDSTSRTALQRPNRLRSDRIGELADASFYYNGREIAVSGNRAGVYATTPAPSNLDDAMAFARDRLLIETPGADLLGSDPYRVLMTDAMEGRYIGQTTVDGIPCHHLAYRTPDLDWQIWIEAGDRPLPRKYVITSRRVQGSPAFAVRMYDWDLSPQLSASLFELQPAPGARRIQFLPPRSAVGGGPASSVPMDSNGDDDDRGDHEDD